MNEAKHTNGPWQWSTPSDTGRGHKQTPLNCGGRAIVLHEAAWEVPPGVARLIAAAPDLLAACKNALAFAEYAFVCEQDRRGFDPQNLDVTAIRAAIAKAEGNP